MLDWFVCLPISMVTSGKATGLEKTLIEVRKSLSYVDFTQFNQKIKKKRHENLSCDQPLAYLSEEFQYGESEMMTLQPFTRYSL